MNALRCALVCVTFVCVPAAAHSQDTVDPDRPDVTNSASIVGTARWQFEMGGIYSRDGSRASAFGSPVTVRIGLAPWIEARIGSDGILSVANGESRTTGMGNVQVGSKIRVWANDEGLPLLSILPAINLPTASSKKGLGSGSADYTIAALAGTDLGGRAHVDGNYAAGAIGNGKGRSRFVQHLVSVSANLTAGPHWNPYLEAFWFSRQSADGKAVTATDFGAIYRVSSRLAIDGGAQFGLSDAAPGFAVFGGITVIAGEGRSNERRGAAAAPVPRIAR